MDSLTAARERHVPLQRDPFGNLEPTVSECCAACKQPWPCDFALAIEALDRRTQEWLRAIDFLNKHADERDAAHALADELAAALDKALRRIHENDDAMGHSYCASQSGDYVDECDCGYDDEMEAGRLALQRHREARK